MDSFAPPPNTEEMVAEEADLRNKTQTSQSRSRRRRQPRQKKEEGAEATEDAVIGEEDEVSDADEDNTTSYYPFVMKVRTGYMCLSLMVQLSVFLHSFLFSALCILVCSTWKCRLGCCLPTVA